MVIVKLNPDTNKEKEVEIVDPDGTWHSGKYHIFAAPVNAVKNIHLPESKDTSSPDFLGEISINKDKSSWKYHSDKLSPSEQEQIAAFILDYRAPDGVY